MGNMDKARELTRVAAESQGAAEAKYAAYLNSAEAATKRLQNAWEGLTTSFQASEVVKDVKNFLAFLVENLDHILTTITSIFVTFRATRAANVLREYGGLTKMIGHNFRGAYNAVTPEEIAKYSKTASGRMGLKAKGYTDFYLGKDKADIASYMPTFRNQLDKIIGLLSGNGNSATGGSGTATGSGTTTGTGGKGNGATGGNQGTGNGLTQRVPLVMNPNLQPVKDAKGNPILYKGKYEQFEVGGKIYYPTTGGWHDAKTGRFVSTKEAQNAGLLVNPSGVAQKSASKQYGVSAVIGSVIGGVTTGIGFGTSAKDSDGVAASQQAKFAGGLAAGLTSTGLSATGAGLGFLAGGPLGMMMGQMAGTLIGNIVGPLLADVFVNLIDSQDIARRERSKQASEMLDAVRGIRGDTTEMKELATSGEWSFDTYQKASTTAANMMTKLYASPEVALRMYNSLTGNTSTNSGQALRYLEARIQDNFLNATPQERKEFVANWEAAQYGAENDYLFGSKEDERYQRAKQIAENSHKISGAGGRESGAINEFVSLYPDEVMRSGSDVYFLAHTIEERVATARRLKFFLQSKGLDQKYNSVRNLDKYIAEMSTVESEKVSTAKEQNEAALRAAGSSLKFSQYSTKALKELGREGVGKLILEELNAQGGLYGYNEAGQIQRTPYTWTGSFETLPDEVRTRIQELINSDPVLSKVFVNNQGYTLGEMKAKQAPNVSEKGRQQYLIAFANALGLSLEQLANQTDRLKDFTLEQLTKGYEDTKSDIESLSSIFSNMASASGLTADNVETLLSKFPALAKFIGDTSSLAKAIYDNVDVLVDVQKQNIISTILTNEKTFDTWVENLPDNIKKAIEEVFDLDKIKSGESFYDHLLSLSPENRTKLEKKLGKDAIELIKNVWKAQYDNMQFASSIAETIFGTESSYLSKAYEIQIKNLESQKAALQQINSQREYENKLIDARNKLENAQNEKRQVYREGVGFVYEADQEAIKQAQKELDDLDNQKTISELEATITELQSQKAWLDQSSDRRAFENVEAMMTNIASSNNSGLWGSVNNLQKSIDNLAGIMSAGVSEMVEEKFNIESESEWASYNDAIKDAEAYQQIASLIFNNENSLYDYLPTLKEITAENGYGEEAIQYASQLASDIQKLQDIEQEFENNPLKLFDQDVLTEYQNYGSSVYNRLKNIGEYYDSAITRSVNYQAKLENKGFVVPGSEFINAEDMLGENFKDAFENLIAMRNLKFKLAGGEVLSLNEFAEDALTASRNRQWNYRNDLIQVLAEEFPVFSQMQIKNAVDEIFGDQNADELVKHFDQVFYNKMYEGENYVSKLSSIGEDFTQLHKAAATYNENHDNINAGTLIVNLDEVADVKGLIRGIQTAVNAMNQRTKP